MIAFLASAPSRSEKGQPHGPKLAQASGLRGKLVHRSQERLVANVNSD